MKFNVCHFEPETPCRSQRGPHLSDFGKNIIREFSFPSKSGDGSKFLCSSQSSTCQGGLQIKGKVRVRAGRSKISNQVHAREEAF